MMGFWLRAAVIAAVAYFLGCFNGAVIVSKYILRDDVRNHGSGNAGLTNFYRTFGGPLTLVVILTDMLKAVLAVLVGIFIASGLPESAEILGPSQFTALEQLVQGEDSLLGMTALLGGEAGSLGYDYVVLGEYWAGLFCLLGHMFPCMFHFKGGKGILSGGAIAIMIDWRIALVVWGGFLILAVLTKYVSLGSCWAGASFPFATWFVYHDMVITALGAVIGGLILYMHRGNIHRLLTGTENKFSLHKKK